jgi:putative heme degradation protein
LIAKEPKLFRYASPTLLAVVKMAEAELKIKIPERVKQEFPEVEWSKVAERAVREEFRKLASIKLFDELFKHSELTDEDCLKLGVKR